MINKFICVLFIFGMCQCMAGALKYPPEANFSDIFKGYEVEVTKVEAKLNDPLIDNIGSREISELAGVNKEAFDEVRKLAICNEGEEYKSVPGSGQEIASAFLSKVCFLFLDSHKRGVIWDSHGSEVTDEMTTSKLSTMPEETENILCDVKDDEKKWFILSIRQAILKIALNPVGRRLFARILKAMETDDKKILILQTKSEKMSFSFYKQLTEKFKENGKEHVCVTVPWKLGKSSKECPGAGAVRTKTCKQLAVRVGDGGVTDDMNIIDKSSSDEKPFYISLCHEFIHCLHYLEEKIVGLDEDNANKMIFSKIYKKCFLDKNADSIFQTINFHYFFNIEDKEYKICDFDSMKQIINSFKCEKVKDQDKIKLNMIVNDLLLWSSLPFSEDRVINWLYSELYGIIVDGSINTSLLKHALKSVINHCINEFVTKQILYDTQEQTINVTYETRYKLIQSILKNIALKYFSSQMISDCYFKDYTNGEEIYTVTGLRYDITSKTFVIDNVSELSFNALEANKIIRISYSSDLTLSKNNDYVLNNIRGKLVQLVNNGQAKFLAQLLLKLFTGKQKFDNLEDGEALEKGLCDKLGVTGSSDIFDFIW